LQAGFLIKSAAALGAGYAVVTIVQHISNRIFIVIVEITLVIAGLNFWIRN